MLLDAEGTDYIDPDVLSLIREFYDQKAPARGVQVSFLGFRKKYRFDDRIQYVDYSTRELQDSVTPDQVLEILKAGHRRFITGQRLTRDLGRQVKTTAEAQHPLAVVLSCIDSRTSVELIFDLGLGDIFSIRMAGNITSREVLGSLEYSCAAAHAKLILVLGHTRCGAVTAAVNSAVASGPAAPSTAPEHVADVLREIQAAIDPQLLSSVQRALPAERDVAVDAVARANVLRTVDRILESSETIRSLVLEGRVAIVGAMYDVVTANIVFLTPSGDDQASSTPM